MAITRAAIIIAVHNAADLPELQAALEGAKAMQKWAKGQKFGSVATITDEKRPVTAERIKKAVEKIHKADSYDQLLIYFAGHGVNLGSSEFWLLTGAPRDPQEAVNVVGSAQLAKRCGIPHVIFISDACRTAAEGIRAQQVRGSEIFPNDPRPGRRKAVDVFYASGLGEPALEIQDKNVAASRYVSIYTDELLAALRGDRRGILSPDTADSTQLYLRPHPLDRHLMAEVPKLIAARLGAAATETQLPEADILSDERAFLQTFEAAKLKPAAAPLSGVTLELRKRGPAAKPPKPTIRAVAADALKKALAAPKGGGAKAVTDALDTNVPGAARISAAVQREREGFGPDAFETRCGFKVRGAALKGVFARHGIKVEHRSPELARITVNTLPATNVVLEFDHGRAVVLPAVRGFLAALTFERGELRNVSYEPSANQGNNRWKQYLKQRDELTALRALIASSVQAGTFRLEGADAPKLTERIRFVKGLDPTMALYAAYSYYRLDKTELIQEMEKYLFDDLRLTFFDLALLSERESPLQPMFPFAPLLAQGWSLLGAFDAWTPLLKKLRPFVVSSLWTLYDKAALPDLRGALKGS